MAGAFGRRKFITLLSGAAAAPVLWPRAARTQQPLPVIGFLNGASPAPFAERLRGFRQGLREAGYVEGENVTIEYRWAEGQFDRLPAMAAELARRPVALIAATGGNEPAFEAKAATTTIPIVFVVGEDPIKLGLVTTFARPSGNLTGVNFFVTEVASKRLELMHALLPTATRIAVLVNPAAAFGTGSTLQDLETAGRAMGLQIQVLRAASAAEIDTVFATLGRQPPDALFVAADVLFTSRRAQLIALAARHAIPATYASREITQDGGLMSYGPSGAEAYRQAGVYAGRILKGTKVADLPVVRSTRFDLVINLKTAQALGLTVPATLLATADEVIE